ncbi:MAG: 16S rRNA (adenine(1518)-N(6)/adenine(1519)-N(6))-dimethyltransferase [Gammaproteobacteria bacterium RIFCSPHIGHO2_12_FULL_41_20]|nr:MAG: 16S rRNA (adenine(1518)-N(6)/adenine(1519)-N(6))-dimethyltransferase [Gammaproteobacteria bacterium RIFCSPHIGHO2_12_FULL_41_20]
MPHSPRKRFGQHFLHDQSIIAHILAAMHPQPHQHWVEIGPGQGALTIPMLKKIQQLDAIELDRDLIISLQAQCVPWGILHLYNADALAFDFAQLKRDNQPLHIFGNLPYNISTPLLFHLLTFATDIASMHFMLQKEVADRLAAKSGTANYGRLSVMMQYHCQADYLLDVPAHCFTPPPKVASSVIRLTPYASLPYPCHQYSLLELVVKHAFGQRRKTLRNSLREFIDDATWQALPIDSSLRAEALTPKDFVMLVNALSGIKS